ncbi:MAG: AAA family ATPase [Caldilineaceae bacterium]|nr:AAA family ATPase [Caldilineaceae bacterium]
MTARLKKRLSLARRNRFFGRSAELELFQSALSRDLPDFAVLHVHGPGGIGKTTLLREFAHLAQEAGRQVVSLDGRNLDPSPVGFLSALHLTLNLQPHESASDRIAYITELVLLIDTYERMMPLDGWLREHFLPQLSERAIVVIAGRQSPSPAWRSDDGWGELTRIIALRNLRPEESNAYLQAQNIPEAQRAHLLDLTYGHPLALSLAADVANQNRDDWSASFGYTPDVLRSLLERFITDLPNPLFRQALEICAHAFTTQEEILAHCLGEEAGYAAFQWLRQLSFVEQGPHGLFPHDLVREVLEADLRWRNLKRFREVHTQVRSYIIKQIMTLSGSAQQFAIFALLFLHRNNPFMRPFYEWQTLGQIYIDKMQPSDLTTVEAIILRHQGIESLAVMRHWQERQPQGFYIFRTAEGVIAGFCHVVEMHTASFEDLRADPATRSALDHLQSVVPLRSQDAILYFRNWMDAEQYQLSPSIFNMAAMVSLRLYFNTPSFAYSFIASRHSDHYAGMFEYLRKPLAPTAAFTIDGQDFGVFVHDWRVEPVLKWLEIMGERELLDEIVALENLPRTGDPMALSEPAFANAVRQALKEFRHLDKLAQSPLLHSRCLYDRVGNDATPAQLQTLLRDTAELLTHSPKDQKLHRVLYHTYFEPVASQELAAELLDLPFSTFRYQLGKAIDKIVALLWQQELYGNSK